MDTGIKVLDAMTRNPIYVAPHMTLGECASIMAEEHVGALVVKDKTTLGIITEHDIVRKVIAKGINPISERVRDYMQTDLITISPNEDVFNALMRMRDENIRHLPVLENSSFVGLLTLKDILRIEPQLFEWLADKIEVREAERKLNKGICQICGEYTEKANVIDNLILCGNCK